MKFHHIAIIVSDKKASLHFYQTILGFELLSETFREERNSWKIDLKKNSMQLEVFTFPGAPARPSYPEAMGLRHLAFEVENIGEWHDKLSKENVGVEEIRVDPGTLKKFFFFHDPDGLPLEMYES